MSDTIKPCPFCGMTRYDWDDWKVIELAGIIKCQNCGASAPLTSWDMRSNKHTAKYDIDIQDANTLNGHNQED